MEGAAGGVVLAGLFELYAAINHFDDIEAIQKVIEKSLRKRPGMALPYDAGYR